MGKGGEFALGVLIEEDGARKEQAAWKVLTLGLLAHLLRRSPRVILYSRT